MTYPTKIQVKNATIGISTVLLIKSKKSRNCMPSILMESKTPKPKAEGTPNAREITNAMIHVLILDQCSFSIIIETIVSNKEIEEVNAANNTRIKNAVPITEPNCIFANTFGSAMNIRDGPAPRVAGSPPENANTDGITIKAA